MSESKLVKLRVNGMTCVGCVNAVTRVIKRLDPGASVTIDLPDGNVEAMTAASPERIATAISAGGYEARLL
jgi:copper chaperone